MLEKLINFAVDTIQQIQFDDYDEKEFAIAKVHHFLRQIAEGDHAGFLNSADHLRCLLFRLCGINRLDCLLALHHIELADMSPVDGKLHLPGQPTVGLAVSKLLSFPPAVKNAMDLLPFQLEHRIGERAQRPSRTVMDADAGVAVGAEINVSITFTAIEDGGIGEDHLAAAIGADGWDFNAHNFSLRFQLFS